MTSWELGFCASGTIVSRHLSWLLFASHLQACLEHISLQHSASVQALPDCRPTVNYAIVELLFRYCWSTIAASGHGIWSCTAAGHMHRDN